MHKLTALLLAALVPACTTLDTDSDTQAVGVVRPPPIGFGGAAPATLLSAYATTAAGISVAWTEPGGNAITVLERQTYDLAGNALGNFQEVSRWTNAAAGHHTYYDPAQIGGGIGAKTVTPIQPAVRFSPDTQVVYRIVEIPPGYTTCLDTTTGTCAFTTTTGYLPKATKYSVGRMQLTLKTVQGAATPAALHVRARVNTYAETWLDSTNANFSTSSLLRYDLTTTGITGLQDVQYIDVWTPDADGICVGEVDLSIDGKVAYAQTYPSCLWVKNGSSIHVPFATMRSNTLWKTYAPDTYLDQTPPITFIGYNATGLIAHLDGIVGSQLREYGSAAGPTARLGSATTTSRTNASHLHVQQHLLDLGGSTKADPSYDLVIHHADSTCAGWCVHVENFDGGASGGWLDLIGVGFLIEDAVNDSLAASFNGSSTTLEAPAPFTFCFPDPNTTVSITNPAAGRSVTDQGHAVVWDRGSLTICGAGFNP